MVHFSEFGCDCGCTSAQFTRKELNPGESTLLRMAINLSGRDGPQKFSCHWQDDSGRRWTATTKVTIYRPARFDPDLLKLGDVAAGQNIKRQVNFDEFANAERELPSLPPFAIASLHNDPVRIEVLSSTIETLGPGLVRRRSVVQFQFTVADRGGYSEMHLRTEPPPGGTSQSTRIDWFVRELYEATPPRLAIALHKKDGAQAKRFVRVQAAAGAKIILAEIKPPSSHIQARALKQTNPEFLDIEITVSIPESANSLAEPVILHLGAEGAHVLRIPVTALRLP